MEKSLTHEETIKQQLSDVCEKYRIKVLIDPVEFEIKSPAAVDVEHDEQGNLVGIGVYDGTNSIYFTQITSLLSESLRSISIICHNGIGDFECLRQWGIPVSESKLGWDTMLISHIIDSSRKGYGLKKLAKEELDISYPSYDDIVGKETKKQSKERRTLDKWPVEVVALYNGLDCFVTYQLWQKQLR